MQQHIIIYDNLRVKKRDSCPLKSWHRKLMISVDILDARYFFSIGALLEILYLCMFFCCDTIWQVPHKITELLNCRAHWKHLFLLYFMLELLLKQPKYSRKPHVKIFQEKI